MVETGYRVIRGPNWIWNDQDGGDGHVGTVVEVGHMGNRMSPDKTVIVQWDNGRRTNYRVGYKGAYDLLVFDGAPSGSKHANKRCDGCGRRGIKGIRWQCTQCEDYDLCTRCYMDNVHNIQHKFRRFLTNKSTGVLIPKRAKSTRSQANGIFPGAKVVRGYDWVWGDQDGGNGNIGTITETRGWQNESESSVASVTWPGNKSNVYRVGHRGKVDIKYVIPGKGPLYYREHLPVLGKDTVDPSLGAAPKTCPFAVGDRVKVSLPVEVLKLMQKGHGGWNPKMADLVGKTGVVHRITQAGDVRVQYRTGSVSSSVSNSNPADNNRWTFNQAALTRVVEDQETPIFAINDQVRVLNDYERVKILQSSEHGNWNEKMAENLGQKGVITEVYPDGDVRVKFSNSRGTLAEWTFNPDCLHHEPPRNRNNTSDNSDTPAPITNGAIGPEPSLETRVSQDIFKAAALGDLQALKLLIHKHPNLIEAQWKGRTGLQIAAAKGHVDVIDFLLRKKARISSPDSVGISALHYAMCSNSATKEKCVRLILDECTFDDVNVVNAKKNSPLHIAIMENNMDWAKYILTLGCDVNLQDDMGDTAAHNCVINGDNSQMMRLLMLTSNFDPKTVNGSGFNILHLAAQKSRIEITKAILEIFPDLANCAKEDGFTALHLSSFNDHKEITQLLASKCPYLIDQGDLQKQTPLIFACLFGYAHIVEILVRLGANLEVRKSSDGKNCLEVALEQFSIAEEEETSNYSAIVASEFSETMTSSVDDEMSLDSSLTSTDWKEIRNVLIRNRLHTSKNVIHLAIACYLVRLGADPTCINQKTGLNAFEWARDQKTRDALQECYNHKTMPKYATEYSNQVELTEKPIHANLTSPSDHPSCSRRSPHKDLNGGFPNNFVTSVEDDDFRNNIIHSKECMSCAEEIASVTFRPCGHKIVCFECCVRMKKCIKCHVVITEKEDAHGNQLHVSPPSIFKSIPSVEQQETVMKLEQKVRELQESNQCIICMEQQRDTALRCGHRFCQKCASNLRKYCPICRKPITGTIRLY